MARNSDKNMERALHIDGLKIAVVHDWLVTFAGAEKVLEQIITCFPNANVFSVVDFLPENDRRKIAGKRATTTFIQKLPKAHTHYQLYLPLMPLAVEQLDLSGYDIVLSSSHAVAKGVLTGPDQLHISYVHSPIRYAWDMHHQYLRDAGFERGVKSGLARLIMHYMRIWDARTASGVDTYIANSEFIRRRIRKAYGREAKVIYPPVDVAGFTLREDKEDFYLTASRLVPYKKIPMIVEAFQSMPERKLVVIGDGTDMKKCRHLAGSNVEILGWQSFSVLKEYMQRAKAFLFAAEEDFGIIPLEAQACGTPVIAYGKGGVLETVRDLGGEKPTGILYREQTPMALRDAILRFEKENRKIVPHHCRENALSFSPENFRRALLNYVDESVHRWIQV